MANCKECIHYRICLEYLSFIAKEKFDEPPFPAENAETTCEHFKDRTRIIDLPCKIGDTVYFIGKHIYCDTIDKISIEKLSDKDVFYRAYCEQCRMPLEFEEFGKIAFLTQEEAERALKEREIN